jgi:hypothetical protein
LKAVGGDRFQTLPETQLDPSTYVRRIMRHYQLLRIRHVRKGAMPLECSGTPYAKLFGATESILARRESKPGRYHPPGHCEAILRRVHWQNSGIGIRHAGGLYGIAATISRPGEEVSIARQFELTLTDESEAVQPHSANTRIRSEARWMQNIDKGFDRFRRHFKIANQMPF